MKNKEKNKVGRPLKIDDAKVGKLREAFLMGCNDLEACQYAEIHRDTLYNFQNKNPEFTEQKEQWKRNPILKAKKTVFENLDDPKTAQWYLDRKCKDEFSPKFEQEIKTDFPAISFNILPVRAQNSE